MSTETKTRGAYREQITKLIKFSDEVIKTQPLQLHDTANAQATDETTVETVSLLKLRGILDSIQTKLEMLRFSYTDIIDLIHEEKFVDKIIELDDIIENYCR